LDTEAAAATRAAAVRLMVEVFWKVFLDANKWYYRVSGCTFGRSLKRYEYGTCTFRSGLQIFPILENNLRNLGPTYNLNTASKRSGTV
jgi:hypothetical protein